MLKKFLPHTVEIAASAREYVRLLAMTGSFAFFAFLVSIAAAGSQGLAMTDAGEWRSFPLGGKLFLQFEAFVAREASKPLSGLGLDF